MDQLLTPHLADVGCVEDLSSGAVASVNFLTADGSEHRVTFEHGVYVIDRMALTARPATGATSPPFIRLGTTAEAFPITVGAAVVFTECAACPPITTSRVVEVYRFAARVAA